MHRSNEIPKNASRTYLFQKGCFRFRIETSSSPFPFRVSRFPFSFPRRAIESLSLHRFETDLCKLVGFDGHHRKKEGYTGS